MTYSPAQAFAHTSGPRSAKMVLVGEAWGEREEALGGAPFAGESGKELFRMLCEALPDVDPAAAREMLDAMRYGDTWVRAREQWLASAGIMLTNVLALRPPANQLEALCVEKKATPPDYLFPSLARGKYLDPQFLPEVSRLAAELRAIRPNLLVALGNTALWATMGSTNIGSVRGVVAAGATSGACPGTKVLPTYHPAGVLRQWGWRPIVVADLLKAARESKFPEVLRPARRVLVDPSLSEVRSWVERVLRRPPKYLSPDIETASGMITCIGFAASATDAIVIPFVDKRKPSWSYWEDPKVERAAWEQVALLLESPVPKVGQNFIYDLQYITRMGIRPRNCLHDTMLLHHSIFPEIQKGLGFLGSIYTNEAAWKLLRKRKADTEKKDE